MVYFMLQTAKLPPKFDPSSKGVKCINWAQIAQIDEELALWKDFSKKTLLTDLIFLLFNQSGQKCPVQGTWLYAIVASGSDKLLNNNIYIPKMMNEIRHPSIHKWNGRRRNSYVIDQNSKYGNIHDLKHPI